MLRPLVHGRGCSLLVWGRVSAMAVFLLKDRIEHALQLDEIGVLRCEYLTLIDRYPFPNVQGSNYQSLLGALKRRTRRIGPYFEITFFEAANRIASDLTLIEGVTQLFTRQLIATDAKLQLRLGTMQAKDKGDFSLFDNGIEIQGEAFDVAPTFFRSKLYKTLHKWREKQDLQYVVFNEDCLADEGCKGYFAGQKEKNPHLKFIQVKSWHQHA